ncbi:MAG: DUF1549 and DUF1553 domain-containing protein, partial [Planctomycetota bacterium]|nr:DUF1549 and DUF1553 domain-containing protein [Planctomycetota bacterium]
LECAQCHNHPFDKWTQREYFEMVAFTGGIRYQQNVRQNERVRRLSRQAQQKWGRNGVRALRRIYQNVTDGIYGTGTGGARLPKDYKYEDAKPQSWVFASAIMGPKTTVTAELPNEGKLRERLAHKPQKLERILRRLRPKEIDSRETFANWMTSPRNERFAKVIANRLWKRAMGRGLIEPVDDIKDTTKSVAPELMAELTDLVVELEFDLKELQRVMLYTRHWRRAAVVPDSTPGTLKDQRGPLLRRMTAEQIWDSLLTLVVRDIDKTIDPAANPRVEEVYSNFETLANGGDEEILRRTELLALRYSSPEKFRAQRRKEQMRIRDEQRRLRTAARPLFKELARARRDRDEEKIQRIVAELQQRGIRLAGGRAGRALRDMQRASDLPSPAPAGHLLAELGQSNRDLIEAGHTDPTVPQVLALLNAFIEQRLLLNNTAVLSRALTQARTPDATLRTAFWAVLNRAPTAREKSTWRTDISRNRKRGIQDLVWTLVNTHEFLFIQ